MVVLSELAQIRGHRTLRWAHLSALTGIDWERLKHFESVDPKRRTEPWFDEAIIIARALCTHGIWPLITSGPVKDLDLGKLLPDDLDLAMFRSGTRLKLSVACRVAIRLGLSDPIELVQPYHGLVQELWQIIASGERQSDPGNCPWCNQRIVGDAGHLPTCLPDHLFGARGDAMAPRIKALVPPEQRGVGRPAASQAWGLAAVRTARSMKQHEMAAKLGYKSVNHYAQVERGEIKLRLDKAAVFANILGVDVHDLFKKSVEQAMAQPAAEHAETVRLPDAIPPLPEARV